jgi:hypothetical protein
VLGLERPPRWGIVALVVLVVVNAALLTYLALRPTPADPLAGRPAPVAETSPASSAPTATAAPAQQTVAATEPVLAVYGDGYSTGSQFGGQGATGWPALVASAIGARLELHAVSQAGYAAVGTTGQTLGGIVEQSPVADASVTVAFVSRNDLGETAAAVGESATATFERIRAAAPDTRLVVVGPTWSSAAVPADLVLLRDAVADAAAAVGAVFVDPIADEWFSQPGTLIASDGITPTDAGHAYLAERITPAVQQALSVP